MWIRSTSRGTLVPRLSDRDFTLCKAALLVTLIVLGHWATRVEAGETLGRGWITSAFCDSVVEDIRV